MLLGFLEGLGLGVSEEEGERGRFDIWFVGGGVVGKEWSLDKVVGAWCERRGYF